MAYTLQAIVADADVLGPVATWLPSVPLSQGKVLIPLTDAVRALREVPHLPLTDGSALPLPDSLARLCVELSALGRIAYLEAEFFGGDGAQAALLAERGQLLPPPLLAPDAVSSALRFLGVVRGQAADEFEALQLGAHRSTEDWLAVSKLPR